MNQLRLLHLILLWTFSGCDLKGTALKGNQNFMLDFLKDDPSLRNSNLYKWRDRKGPKRTILIYTSLFGNPEWTNVRASDGDILLEKYGCPVTNCHLKYKTDENNLNGADIVVFHDRDMPDSMILKGICDYERPKNQIWVYFTGENPVHSQYDVSHLDDLFDWTMTYKHDSDIWVPYSRYYPIKERKSKHDYAKSKTKLIAWIASDCGQIRDRVVFELNKILPVDVAGKCSASYLHKFDCVDDESCHRKISNYKFYLAFENKHCNEYVTEKYWYKGIRSGVVPVVLGAGPYDDPSVAIPGSYINALDFKTIADLGQYLKYLDKNDTAYNEYFKWKERYTLWKPACDWPFEPYWACRMCFRLNEGLKHKQRVKMSDYWSIARNCEGGEHETHKLLEKSGHDFSGFSKNSDSYENPYNKVGREIDYEEEKTRKEENNQNLPEDYPSEQIGVENFEPVAKQLFLDDNAQNEAYMIVFIFSISVVGFLFYMCKRY